MNIRMLLKENLFFKIEQLSKYGRQYNGNIVAQYQRLPVGGLVVGVPYCILPEWNWNETIQIQLKRRLSALIL